MINIRVGSVLRRGNSGKNVGQLEIRKSMVHRKLLRAERPHQEFQREMIRVKLQQGAQGGEETQENLKRQCKH